MARFDFRLDLAVGEARLAADPDGPILTVCALCIIMEETGEPIWVDDTSFPIGGWALDNVKQRAQMIEEIARQEWPQLYGATDWWIPNAREFEQMHGQPYDGSQQL